MSFVPHTVCFHAPPEVTRRGLLVHGILGSAKNLAPLARRLGDAVPGLGLWGVDLRNHGASQGAPPPHTLAAAAADLTRVEAEVGPFDLAIGHSYGAKVALAFAKSKAGARPIHVVVLDAPLSTRRRFWSTSGRDEPKGELELVFEAIRAIDPAQATRREEVVKALLAAGLRPAVARWLSMNLVDRGGGGLRWRFELKDIEAMLDDYFRVDFLGFLETKPAGVSVHVVLGGESDRLDPLERARLEELREAGLVALDVLPGTGHWLHADDPAGLVKLIVLGLPPA